MNWQKKSLIGIGIVLALAIGYWLASPLWKTEKVSESLEEIMTPSVATSTPEVIAKGTFSGLQAHSAEGEAKLIKSGDKYFVRFENNFKVTNGPDLFVYFGKNGQYAPEARLGALKGNVGGQNYEVPQGIDVSSYNEVWVWCRAFSVAFGKATLQ